MKYGYRVVFIAYTDTEVWLDHPDEARAIRLAATLVESARPDWEVMPNGVEEISPEDYDGDVTVDFEEVP